MAKVCTEEEARRYAGNADFWREQHQQARKLALEENAKAIREAKAAAYEEAALVSEHYNQAMIAAKIRQLAAAEKSVGSIEDSAWYDAKRAAALSSETQSRVSDWRTFTIDVAGCLE